MSKYSELKDAYRSTERSIEAIRKSFDEAFRAGFSGYLDCRPNLIGSKMTSRPVRGRGPVVLYMFELYLDVTLDDYPTKRLVLPIKALGTPDGSDATKFRIKLSDEKGAPAYRLDADFYQVVFDEFKKQLAE